MSDRPEPTIADLVRMYFDFGINDVCHDAKERKLCILKDFAAAFGAKRVTGLRAIDVTTWLAGHSTWKSAGTYNSALAIIRRLFNWSIEQELVERNPSERVKLRRKTSRRLPMSDEHFQTLMRTADPTFRRFLIFLKFTGCRPSEASNTRWRNVRFEERAIVLTQHKTAAKTGRPRVIPLIPPVLKLLVWLRSHRQATCIGLVEQFLLRAGGEMKAIELGRLMKPYGVSARAVARARTALGVEKVWAGPDGSEPSKADGDYITEFSPFADAIKATLAVGATMGEVHRKLVKEHGITASYTSLRRFTHWLKTDNRSSNDTRFYLYSLPADHVPLPDPTLHDFVFTNALGNGFNRRCLTLRMQRLRVRAGLPKGVILYQLRHRFFFQGIKNRVNLKLLSLAGGHARTQMTEGYIHEAGLTEDVYEGALQAAYGPGAVGVPVAPPPRPIPIVTPPPVQEIEVAAEYLPSRANTERERPQVRLQPEQPTNGAIETLLKEVLKRLPAKLDGRRSGPALALPLRPSEELAWQTFRWAMEQNPALASAKDSEVFAWLKSRQDCPHKLPPLFATFTRYVSKARLFYDERKRVLRDRQPPPPQPEEQGGAA